MRARIFFFSRDFQVTKNHLLSLVIALAASHIFVSPSRASLTDPDLDIDFDDADLARIEGWVKSFPSSVRKELEVFVTSDALAEGADNVMAEIVDNFECIGDIVMSKAGERIADTVLANNNYSKFCIKQIGETPPAWYQFWNKGRNYNLDQKYKLEKCELAQYGERNDDHAEFVSNMKSKSQTLRSTGFSAMCRNEEIPNGKQMLIEGADYYNAWEELNRKKVSCGSMKNCFEKSVTLTNEILNTMGSCDGQQATYQSSLSKIVEIVEREAKSSVLLNWGIYETYNLRRLVANGVENWNKSTLEKMGTNCKSAVIPPLHGIRRNPPAYVDKTSSIAKIYAAKDKIVSDVESMQANGEACVSNAVREYIEETYSKMTRQPTQTFTCVDKTYSYVQRTDCQGVVSPGPVGHKIRDFTRSGNIGFGNNGLPGFNRYRAWVYQSDQRGVAHGC